MQQPHPCALQSPLHYSNVMLADPVTGKPVRVEWRFLEDGTKVGKASEPLHVAAADIELHLACCTPD